MSIESVARVLPLQITDQTEKLILIGIANHDGDGGSWPSMQTLATYACVSQRTARRVVSKLRERGWIKVDYNAGGSAKTPDEQRPNLYRLVWDQIDPPGHSYDRGVPPDTAMSPPDTAMTGAPGHSYDRTPPDTAMSAEPSLNHPQPRDAIELRLIRAFGTPLTEPKRRLRAKVIDNLVQMGVDPVEVSRRAYTLLDRWPTCDAPDTMLVKRWDDWKPLTPAAMYGV